MKTSQIAKETKTSNMMVWYLIKGHRKTTNIPLAMLVAKMTKRRPIEFISEKIKGLALEIHPELNRRVK
jgi:ribonuclease HII